MASTVVSRRPTAFTERLVRWMCSVSMIIILLWHIGIIRELRKIAKTENWRVWFVNNSIRSLVLFAYRSVAKWFGQIFLWTAKFSSFHDWRFANRMALGSKPTTCRLRLTSYGLSNMHKIESHSKLLESKGVTLSLSLSLSWVLWVRGCQTSSTE